MRFGRPDCWLYFRALGPLSRLGFEVAIRKTECAWYRFYSDRKYRGWVVRRDSWSWLRVGFNTPRLHFYFHIRAREVLD